MKRGSIVRVDLEDGQPPEFGKTRPAVVLSNDEANAVLSTVVVIPLSTRSPQIWPLRVKLPALRGLQNSFAVLPGIRQISKERIIEVITDLPSSDLQSLEEACSAYLSG